MRVGVVGHRSLSSKSSTFVDDVCTAVLTVLAGRGGRVNALSALAEGADTVFAEVAIRNRVPLTAVRPHRRYLDDFQTTKAKLLYSRLWEQAHERTRLPFIHRSDVAYQAAMHWVTDRSDILLAVWDGRPSSRRGGTAETIRYARAVGCPVVHIDPNMRTVSLA